MLELRAGYRNTLLNLVNELCSASRSSATARAAAALRYALGAEDRAPKKLDGPAQEKLVEFILSLRSVLQNMATVDQSEEHQIVVEEFEQMLRGLL